MKKAFITIAVATLITGCASNDFDSIPYGCQGEESDKYCASVEDIYKKSVENDHRNINVLAEDQEIVSDGKYRSIQSQKKQKPGDTPKHVTGVKGSLPALQNGAVFGSRALEQKPVYTPEQVHRLFRGPWMDDYEILHSGEHLFYKTPGAWNYGNMSDPGSASGLVKPVYPEDLGFSKPGEASKTVEKKRVGRHVLPSANQPSSRNGTASTVQALKAKAKKLN